MRVAATYEGVMFPSIRISWIRTDFLGCFPGTRRGAIRSAFAWMCGVPVSVCTRCVALAEAVCITPLHCVGAGRGSEAWSGLERRSPRRDGGVEFVVRLGEFAVCGVGVGAGGVLGHRGEPTPSAEGGKEEMGYLQNVAHTTCHHCA